MSETAVVFPGQGCQRRGMALDFVENYREAREAFEQASDLLRYDVQSVCRDDDPRLDLTEFTQPCILTAEMAIFRVLKSHFGFAPALFAGHSLGEYSALVAAGALPFTTALSLVQLRGRLMQTAVSAGTGAMAALISDGPFPRDAVNTCAALCGIDVANDNSEHQVVVSGTMGGVEKFCSQLNSSVKPSLRVVPLVVSAPFHSRLMQPIETPFRQALLEVQAAFSILKAEVVISNFTGTFHHGDSLVDSLTRQISGSVRWRENMRSLSARTQTIVEVGPGRPLNGFFKTIGLSIQSITDLRTAKRAFVPPVLSV